MAKQINPQGYNYGKDPTNSNPFWNESEIAEKLTASASVDDTTGTPEVSVSTTGYNVDFKFSGLKGERGEKGEQGAPGEKGEQGERGASGKDGKNGYNVTMDSTGSKESGTISTILYGYTMENGEYKSATSYVYNGKKGERGEKGEQGVPGATGATPDITATATADNTTGTPAVTVTKSGTVDAPTLAFAFSGIKGEKGEQGEQGEQGIQGPAGKDGSDADVSRCITNVSVTYNNGTYTIKQTKGDGTTTDSGNIVSGVDLFTTQYMYPQPQLSNKHNFPSTAPANGRYFLMELMFRVEDPTNPNIIFDDLTHTIVAKADSSYVKGFEIIIGETIDFLIGTQSKTIIENSHISIDENPFTGNANGSMLVNYISNDGTERKIENMSLWYKGVIS